MKKIIVAVLLLAIISPISASAFYSQDTESRLQALETKIAQCQQPTAGSDNTYLIVDLQNRVAQLENKVMTLESKYAKLEEVVKTFQQQLINAYSLILNFITSIKTKLKI